MAGYEIYFKESVEKDFRTIPKEDLKKILQRIAACDFFVAPASIRECSFLKTVHQILNRRRITYLVVHILRAGPW